MVAYQSPLPIRGTSCLERLNYARPVPPARPNETSTSLGTQTISGVSATGTQLTETIPAGAIGNAQAIQVVRISWISTDLKCRLRSRRSDPRYGNTDMELTNVVEAEPNSSLFVVPAGYTIEQGGGPGGPRGNARRGPGPR